MSDETPVTTSDAPAVVTVPVTPAVILKPGDQTSEHAAMQSASFAARILTVLGSLLAGLPQILNMLNSLPDSLKNNKTVLVGTAAVGGLIAMLGVAKETLTKIAYIQGRSLVKAAAVRDAQVAPPVV